MPRSNLYARSLACAVPALASPGCCLAMHHPARFQYVDVLGPVPVRTGA